MPYAAKRPCAHPGCGRLVASGRCDKHKRSVQVDIDRRRGSSTARGYGYRWQQARAAFLRSNPLCVSCRAEGIVEAATVVDHITPHKGDQDLFWDQDNWQALCKPHHDSKTATEDGRWTPAARG